MGSKLYRCYSLICATCNLGIQSKIERNFFLALILSAIYTSPW